MSELREVHSYDGLTGESRRSQREIYAYDDGYIAAKAGAAKVPAVALLLTRLGQAYRALGEPFASRILNRILTKFADYGRQACICPDCPACEEPHSCVEWKQD